MSGRRADAATRTASTLLRTTATAVLASLLVGAAMLPWWPVYESGAFIVAAVVAALALAASVTVAALTAADYHYFTDGVGGALLALAVVVATALGLDARLPSRHDARSGTGRHDPVAAVHDPTPRRAA